MQQLLKCQNYVLSWDTPLYLSLNGLLKMEDLFLRPSQGGSIDRIILEAHFLWWDVLKVRLPIYLISNNSFSLPNYIYTNPSIFFCIKICKELYYPMISQLPAAVQYMTHNNTPHRYGHWPKPHYGLLLRLKFYPQKITSSLADP